MKKKTGYKSYFNNYYLLTGKSATLTEERSMKEVSEIIKFLNLTGNEIIIDLGCGWGRHVIEFIKKKYSIIGLDQSAAMINKAISICKKKKMNISYIRKDMKKMNFKNKFNIALSLFGSFGYFKTDEEHLLVLKKINLLLKSHGLFYIEFWNRENYLKNHNQKIYHEYNGMYILEHFIFDSNTGKMNIKRIYIKGSKIKEFNISIRLFTYQEFNILLTKSGFKNIKIFGDKKRNILNCESPQMIITATKR